jgi:hypothetical protein
MPTRAFPLIAQPSIRGGTPQKRGAPQLARWIPLTIPGLSLLFIVASVVALISDAIAGDLHIAEGTGFKGTVETTSFDAKRHRMGYRTMEGQKVLLQIDGTHYSGSDGTIPDVEITSIIAEADGLKFSLPRNSFRSLFNPHFGKNFISGMPKVEDTATKIVISFRGGDGAGAYGVSFVIDKASGRVERSVTEHPTPEKPKLASFRARKESNNTVERDARNIRARLSP